MYHSESKSDVSTPVCWNQFFAALAFSALVASSRGTVSNVVAGRVVWFQICLMQYLTPDWYLFKGGENCPAE